MLCVSLKNYIKIKYELDEWRCILKWQATAILLRYYTYIPEITHTQNKIERNANNCSHDPSILPKILIKVGIIEYSFVKLKLKVKLYILDRYLYT